MFKESTKDEDLKSIDGSEVENQFFSYTAGGFLNKRSDYVCNCS